MKMTYSEQLRHPNWQRRRLERLSAANFACAECEGTETTLHVHHRRYVKGRMAWDYPDHELHVLCEDCHASEHEMQAHLATLLTLLPTHKALALIGGFVRDEGGPQHDASHMAAQDADFFAYEAGDLACAASDYLGIDDFQVVMREIVRLRDLRIERRRRERLLEEAAEGAEG